MLPIPSSQHVICPKRLPSSYCENQTTIFPVGWWYTVDKLTVSRPVKTDMVCFYDKAVVRGAGSHDPSLRTPGGLSP